jgi:hypothetical protein
MTGTAHVLTLSKTDVAKGSHLLQIAIASHAFNAPYQGRMKHLSRKNALEALYRAATRPHSGPQTPRRVRPVIVTGFAAKGA